MVSRTIRRARMTLPRGPDTSHWPVPLTTFALAPLCRSISLMVAPPRPMTRPSWPGHGTSMATCSSMSSPLSTSGKSAADASSPESIFARAAARSLAIIVPGVSTCGTPKPPPPPGIEPALARSPLLMSPRSITSAMSAAASRMTASAPVTTHVPRSLRISIFTANLRSMCFTVSPPLPMTRPSLRSPIRTVSTIHPSVWSSRHSASTSATHRAIASGAPSIISRPAPFSTCSLTPCVCCSSLILEPARPMILPSNRTSNECAASTPPTPRSPGFAPLDPNPSPSPDPNPDPTCGGGGASSPFPDPRPGATGVTPAAVAALADTDAAMAAIRRMASMFD
mmetsp:Transcript_2267/g.8772  ORF Transcript_2267/g.8772 Transcript_2267/m.8772 type:complete len:339 (-) Transcript_2267:259-1275(-)